MIRGFILGLIAGSFVALGISTAAWAGRKVAVIVDGGDDRGSSSFRESAEVINQTYLARSRGYQVVRIEAVKGDGIADFHAAFSKLGSDVDELEIVLLAHGVVVPDSRPGVIGADDKRIPKSFLRHDEVSSQLTDDYGPWKLTEGIYFGYHLAPPPKPNAVSSVLGVGDLRRAILEVKNKNPNVPVTVSSLTCYGGNAIRALDTIPGTQVFTSTSSSQYYWTVSKGPDPDVPDPQGVTRAVTPEQCGGKPECLNLGLSNSYLLFFHQAGSRGLLFGGAQDGQEAVSGRRHFSDRLFTPELFKGRRRPAAHRLTSKLFRADVGRSLPGCASISRA